MKKLKIDTKVDVVPVINVSLVIVLTLMIIAPGLDNSETPVDLPIAHAQEAEDSDRLEVTCTLDGQIFVDKIAVEVGEIRAVAELYLAEHPEAMAVVRADRGLLYGEVERVIAELELAKAPQIAIATRGEDLDLESGDAR